MLYLRTFVWFVYFWGYLLIHLPALHRGKKALKNGDFAAADAIANKHVPHWCHKLIKLAHVEITVKGQENIPEGACVFAANHRSYWDIPLMLTSFGDPVSLVAKAEVEKLPLVRGWMYLLRCLFLQRENPRQGMMVINEAAELVKNGRSVGIFPEGTRYKGNEGDMGPFLAGAFRIAAKAQAPIVPVAISNSRAALEGDGHFVMKPAKITVNILPPIETAGIDRKALKEMPEIMQKMIHDALEVNQNK